MPVEQTKQRIEIRLSEANEEITTERRRIQNEIKAFEEFRNCVERVNCSNGQPATSGILTPIDKRPTGTDPSAVREAYESTVMTVPHYSEDYGECFIENLKAELGPELAMMLTQADQIDNRAITVIQSSCDEVIEERQNLLDVIQTEKAALETLSSDLQALATEVEALSNKEFNSCDVEELEAFRTRCRKASNECDLIAEQRQETVRSHERVVGTAHSKASLTAYLYQNLDEQYPILASLAIVGKDLFQIQKHLGTTIQSLSPENREVS